MRNGRGRQKGSMNQQSQTRQRARLRQTEPEQRRDGEEQADGLSKAIGPALMRGKEAVCAFLFRAEVAAQAPIRSVVTNEGQRDGCQLDCRPHHEATGSGRHGSAPASPLIRSVIEAHDWPIGRELSGARPGVYVVL